VNKPVRWLFCIQPSLPKLNLIDELKEMPLNSLVRLVSLRCAEYKTDIWEISDKYGWTYEDATEFIRCRKKPTAKMLCDLAKEFETRAEWLGEILEHQGNAAHDEL